MHYYCLVCFPQFPYLFQIVHWHFVFQCDMSRWKRVMLTSKLFLFLNRLDEEYIWRLVSLLFTWNQCKVRLKLRVWLHADIPAHLFPSAKNMNGNITSFQERLWMELHSFFFFFFTLDGGRRGVSVLLVKVYIIRITFIYKKKSVVSTIIN